MSKKAVNYRLDEQLLEELKAYAEKDQRTITTVVDRAIRAHIGAEKEPEKPHYSMDIPKMGESSDE